MSVRLLPSSYPRQSACSSHPNAPSRRLWLRLLQEGRHRLRALQVRQLHVSCAVKARKNTPWEWIEGAAQRWLRGTSAGPNGRHSTPSGVEPVPAEGTRRLLFWSALC